MEEYHMPETKKLSINLSRFKVVEKNRGSQRGDMLDRFLERVNQSREAAGYKPLSIKRLAMMLAHIPTEDLYAFYQMCEKSDLPFTAKFHYELKVRK